MAAVSSDNLARGPGLVAAAGRTLSQPQFGSKQEKLKSRLSCEAFKVAEATQTGIEADELETHPLGKLWILLFGRTQLMGVVLPIFVEPAFRREAFSWTGVYLSVMLVASYLQVKNTAIGISLGSSVEFKDTESFYYYLLVALVVQVAMLIRSAVQTQARWQVRMLVQWRLQFRMCHALFSENAFHFIQVGQFKADLSMNAHNPAPEALLCRDSFIWLHEFSNMLDALISDMVGVVTSIYVVSKWSYWMALYIIMSVPIRGKILNWLMPRPLHYLHHRMIEAGWDSMFVMSRIQDNSEQIALLRGGVAEFRRFTSSLKILMRNHLKVTLWQNTHAISIQLMGTLILFPVLVKLLYEVCDRGMPVSVAMTYSTQVFMVSVHLGAVSHHFMAFVRHHQTVANMNGLINTGRDIGNALRKRNEMGLKKDFTVKDQILVRQRDPLDLESPVLEMRNVTVWAPKAKGGYGVFLGFSMQLLAGQSMLIVGDTGVGKSALLRAIHGMWVAGTGRVERCHNTQLSCMPERPFTYNGTLRQNLLYPEVEDSEGVTDDLIMEILQALNLRSVVSAIGLDSKAPWHQILSLGQQQRLGFARILLRPQIRLVLLDEATSALDMRNERKIYQLLKERFPCYISVGHRPSVREYHTHVAMLRFKDDRSLVTSWAEFLPIGDVDWQKIDAAAAKKQKQRGSAEEMLWNDRAQKENEAVMKLEKATPAKSKEGASQKGAEQEDEAEDDEEVKYGSTPELISLDRRKGGFSLLVRTMRDIIFPMLTQREVVVPIFLVFSMSYALSYMSMAMDGWFHYPYAQVVSVAQTRNAQLCWRFFWRVLCVYYPCHLIAVVLAKVFVALQFIICRITIKWYLAKCYTDPKADAYYQMSVARIVDGNPGTRIAAWDADTANGYVTGVVSAISHAVFAITISTRNLYRTDQGAFRFYIVYITVGLIFYIIIGYQVFLRYMRWLELTMKLYGQVLTVREFSESVVLLQGCDQERRHSFELMDQAITPGSKYLWLKDAVNFMGNIYFNAVLDLIVTFTTGPMSLDGRLSFHMVNQVKGIIGAGAHGVHHMLNEIVLNVEGQAAMERIWELLATILHIEGATEGMSRFGGDIALEQDAGMTNALELRNVSLKTPVASGARGNAALLMEDVSLSVPFGDSLLIAGESGIGKSSMLRAVAGLWRHGAGTIRVSDDRRSFFIPQRPYLFVGSVRENLLYPDVDRTDVDDELLRSVTAKVGLERLLTSPGLGEDRKNIEERADVNSEKERGWFWKLSLGEMQRLNFGRMLLKQDVRLVFLDEATSALSIPIEETMYKLLKENAGSYISVAHRPQLRRFHQRAFVMLTDLEKPMDALCRTKCLLMSMEAYEKELAELQASIK